MKRPILLLVSVLALSVIGANSARGAEGLSAQLNSYEETPSTLHSPGTGVFLGLIDNEDTIINYQLFYTDVPTVLFAHIHFGKPGESGGVVVFLCGGGGKPPCAAAGELLGGTITAGDVQALPGQNLSAGDMAAFVRAIRNGFTYVNVHTSAFPSGELRGQIKSAAR
jgi:hypothetical protein